ncbi:MAG: L-histidine N(alpha)-methyltransferase [Roseivirga sp.]
MSDTTLVLSTFAEDVRQGLLQTPKTLPSKYFYDEHGDKLFQTIMGLGEYYLTRCEFEIFSEQKEAILKSFLGNDDSFRLVELGAGDGTKTKVLMDHFLEAGADFTYNPIDISQNVLDQLKADLSTVLPKLEVEPIQGDYFDALGELNRQHSRKEVVLFLGSNIGNFSNEGGEQFLTRLGENLAKGDLLLIGFDLMKNPQTILNAYNDKLGVTREFNLNLLTRMNNELGANFDIEKFKHFPTYNPINGETRSHLISTESQQVYIEALDTAFDFDAWEAIHTEVSQKYSPKMIEQFAEVAGFRIVENFSDECHYYVDSLWEKL